MKETMKRYVGVAGDALAYAWGALRRPEAEPMPVGARNERPAPAAAVAGISTGTLLLIGVLWMLMKRRR